MTGSNRCARPVPLSRTRWGSTSPWDGLTTSASDAVLLFCGYEMKNLTSYPQKRTTAYFWMMKTIRLFLVQLGSTENRLGQRSANH